MSTIHEQTNVEIFVIKQKLKQERKSYYQMRKQRSKTSTIMNIFMQIFNVKIIFALLNRWTKRD